jgi:divalent metal cation (Fe/Co/Zn/Cd) transporter
LNAQAQLAINLSFFFNLVVVSLKLMAVCCCFLVPFSNLRPEICVWFLSLFMLLMSLSILQAIMTGSISVAASCMDSFLDVFSGSILFCTACAMKKVDPYKFPSGKTRLEPLGIILFACVMGMAALQIIYTAVSRLIAGFSGGKYFSRKKLHAHYRRHFFFFFSIFAFIHFFLVV